MGLLDDDNLGLLSGAAQAVKAGIQGYQDAEDRQYNRRVMAAKLKAAEAEALRKKDDDDIEAAKSGMRIERDSATGMIKRDATTGRAMISQDPSLMPMPKPLHPLVEQDLRVKIEAAGQKPVMDRNKIVADALEKGFNASFDDGGRLIMTPTKERMAETQARLELMKAKALKAKGGGGAGGGKRLPPNMTAEFGATNAVFQALDDSLKVFEENQDYFNTRGDMVGKAKSIYQSGKAAVGADAQADVIDANFRAKAQVIGKYLEGGKLAAGDDIKYRKMLPIRGDSPTVVKAKVENLQRLVYQKMEGELRALEQGGYDTSRIQRQKPKGLIQEGLIGNDPKGLITGKSPTPVAPAAPKPDPRAAQAWLADPKNANDPRRAAVEAKVKAMLGGQ